MLKHLAFLIGIFLLTTVFVSDVHGGRLGRDVDGFQVQALSLGTVQTVSYTGTSAATSNVISGTNAFGALKIALVTVLCSTDCHVVAGSSPTATTSDMRLPANTLFTFWVTGGTDKLAFIRVSASGTAYVTEAN